MPPLDGEAPDHIQYTITSQQLTESLTADGRFVKVWRVSYEAPNGTHAFVEIPEAEYTPANVDLIIQSELDKIMGVHTLGAEPHPDNVA